MEFGREPPNFAVAQPYPNQPLRSLQWNFEGEPDKILTLNIVILFAYRSLPSSYDLLYFLT